MKTLSKVLAILFLTFFSRTAVSQSETTMQDILEKVSSKVTELEDKNAQEIVNITIDLLVQTTATKQVIRYLDPSFDYKVMVIGDRRISMLKVVVHKKTRKRWEKVTDASGSAAELELEPSDFEQYRFTVRVDQFKGDNITGHFALFIYHEDPTKKKGK